LRRWEELRPELDRRGTLIVTLSTDTPDEIRAGRGKHGLRAMMLSDADLAVTDLYNLRNRRSIAPGRERALPEIRPLPIPTTILVDAKGIVRWIDQAADFQVRSDPARVLAALRALLESKNQEARG
jgi:peroxiredoxin